MIASSCQAPTHIWDMYHCPPTPPVNSGVILYSQSALFSPLCCSQAEVLVFR